MDLSNYIEHTLLKPHVGWPEIQNLCQEAIEHQFVGVCIPPFYVADAVKFLENTPVKVITVVGFPMGYSAISAKVEEAKKAVDDNADEVDMVVNLAAVKDKKWAYVRNDIDSVTRATHLKGKILKVILETGLLDNDEILKLCQICIEVGVDYIKTSTGINGSGATIEAISFIKKCLAGTSLKIKASGGIRNAKFAIQLINAGANRLGTSAGINIIGEKLTV